MAPARLGTWLARLRSLSIRARLVLLALAVAAPLWATLAYALARPNAGRDAVLALVSLVFALTAALLVGRGIGRPAARLADAVRAIGEGNLDSRAQVTGPREIALVAETFNAMVAARAAANAEQRATNEYLNAVLAGAPLAIVALDYDGNVQSWNPAAERMFGWSAEEAIGKPLVTIPEDRVAEFAEQRRRALAGEEIVNAERVRRRKDGSLIDVELSFSPIRDAAGEIRGGLALMAETTARRRAERQVADILESVTDGFVALDSEWRITYVNARAGELFGRVPHELAGKHLWTEFPGAVGRPFQRACERAMAGRETVAIEDYFEPWDRWFDTRIYPGADGGIAIYTQDVTERKRTEQRVADILESVTDGFVALDSDWRYTYVNARAGELFGRAPEDLVGKHIWTEFPEGVGQPFHRAYERAMAERVTVTFDDHYEPWDRWFENRVYPSPDGGIAIYFQEITERKRTEHALFLYTVRLETLVEIGRAILAARSSEEIAGAALGRIRALVGAARASCAAWDEERGEFIGLAADGDRETTGGVGVRVVPWSEALEALRRGEVFTLPDLLERAADPTVFQKLLLDEGLRSYAMVPLMAEGQLVGEFALASTEPGPPFEPETLEVAREIADLLAVALRQARLREELERYSVELEHRVADRTADLEAFSHTVAHDLHAPLRAMRGFGDALLEDYGDRLGDEGRDYAARIAGAAEAMGELISDLLEFSRLSRAELALAPTGLDRVVADALAQNAATVTEKHARVEVESPLPSVTGHRQTLVQAVANLVSNALKFVPPGRAPLVRIRADEADGRVRLWVEDNGIGIAPEHRERVFHVFERLHGVESYPGTGMGLAIVQKAVERMGGDCGFDSGPAGSNFWLELPKTEV